MKESSYENFSIERIKRSAIHPSDYNPRIISDTNFKKLKKRIKNDGMIMPIVVNKRTGNIVSGHQRIVILDDLNKNQDYDLQVSYIDVDEKKEIELNIFLNNQSAMGEWDRDLLYDLKKEIPDLNFINDLGFDKIDIDYMFSGMEIEEGIFQESDSKKKVLSEIDKIAASDYLKEYKKKSRLKYKSIDSDGDTNYIENDDYYISFVFNTNSDKHNFMNKINKNYKEKYLSAGILFDIIKDEYKF